MMRRVLFTLCFVCIATFARAQSPPTTVLVDATTRLEWTPSADDATLVASYRAELFVNSNVAATVVNGQTVWVTNGSAAVWVDQGKPAPDVLGRMQGPPLLHSLQLNTSYIAFLRAVHTDGQTLSIRSNATAPFSMTASTPTQDACTNHSITIAVIDWDKRVAVGTRGRMLFQLLNDYPIVQLQVQTNAGMQALAEINGTELRDMSGLYFSLPRTVGDYNLSVFARDSKGCTAHTTAPRVVTVF